MTRHSSENNPTNENKPDSQKKPAPGNKSGSGNKAVKFNAQAQASGAVDKLFGARQGERVLSGLKLIQHNHIEVKAQPRTSFSETEVAELASSISTLHERGEGIESTGILQPLLVALQDNSSAIRYRLIAGERRFRASQQAGLTQVPCLVLTVSEKGILPVQLIENLQRQNLAPLDEGRALQQLKDEQNLSVRDIAKSIGKTRGYVTNRLDLLKMGADVQAMVSSREDTLKHAAIINGVQDADLRSELIRAVIEDSASVKTIENRINAASNDSFPPHPAQDSPHQDSPVQGRSDLSHSDADQADNNTTSHKPPLSYKPPIASAQENLQGLELSGETEAPNEASNIAEELRNSYTSPDSDPGQDSDPSDFIAHSLQPAEAFLAAAARQAQVLQLENLQLEGERKQQVRDLIKTFREHLEQIERAVK